MKTKQTGFKPLFEIFFIILLAGLTCTREPILKEVFKNNFYIGTALNRNQIFRQDSNALIIAKKHFNSITAENIMKWEKIHPKPNEYNFEPADRFVELGEENQMFIIGHVLVWHAQTPEWVFQDESGNLTSRDTLLHRMHDHIHTVMGRYKGRVHGWDVVNEAVDDNGQWRKNIWYEIIGEDYVQKAFEYARDADPDAELYYNDYSLPTPVKRGGVVRLIRDLQTKGVKVDGIGMQGHYHLDYPELNELEASIIAFSELGVKVMITELEITVLPRPSNQQGADISMDFEFQKKLNPYTAGLPDSMQVQLTNRYSELFNLFVKHSDKISRVTLWGIHDGQSWRNNWPVRGRTDYPLLFDRNYQPKPAFDAVIQCAEKKN